MENRSAIVTAVAAACVVLAVVIAFSWNQPSADDEAETSRRTGLPSTGVDGAGAEHELPARKREARERRREAERRQGDTRQRNWDPLSGRSAFSGDERPGAISLGSERVHGDGPSADRGGAVVAAPEVDSEQPSAGLELLPEAAPTPIALSRIGAVPEEFVASANSWLGELINAANTADVSKLIEMTGLPEDAAPALAKYFEERPNMELQAHDASIESRGGNRIRIKYTRVDTWYDRNREETLNETIPTEYNLYLDNGRWRFESQGS